MRPIPLGKIFFLFKLELILRARGTVLIFIKADLAILKSAEFCGVILVDFARFFGFTFFGLLAAGAGTSGKFSNITGKRLFSGPSVGNYKRRAAPGDFIIGIWTFTYLAAGSTGIFTSLSLSVLILKSTIYVISSCLIEYTKFGSLRVEISSNLLIIWSKSGFN